MQITEQFYSLTRTHAIQMAHIHLLLIFADNKVVSLESLKSLRPLLLAGAEDRDLQHKQQRQNQP